MHIRRIRRTQPRKPQKGETKLQNSVAKERQNGWRCNKTECGKNFPAKKQLLRRNQCYCNAQAKEQPVINSKQIRKLDRRKQLQEGVPKHEHNIVRNIIKYNVDTDEWDCAKFPKTYENNQWGMQYNTHVPAMETKPINAIQRKEGTDGGKYYACAEYEHCKNTSQEPNTTQTSHHLTKQKK